MSDARSGLRFMVNDDNFFVSMRNLWSDYRTHLGAVSDFNVVSLYELHGSVRAEAKRSVGRYDVLAIDNPWLGEFVTDGLLRPLDDLIADSSVEAGAFNTDVWSTGNWKGRQYGIPIYTTIEVLAARTDLFSQAGITYPRTFDQTVEAAARLHRPARDVYGIGWNCAPGLPIASTFMILLGCCGAPLLRYPLGRRGYQWSELEGDQFRPNILSDQARIVLDYMHRLIPYSPPNILELDWNGRLGAFMAGRLAMTYCWSMRAARFEYDIASQVKRKVTYLTQPKGPGGVSANPIGGFHLTIPCNVGDAKARLAFEAIAWLAQSDERRGSGFPVAPRFSTAADPEVAQSTHVFTFAETLAKRGMVCASQRPAIPEYTRIEAILGDRIHAAMRGEITDDEALIQSQNRVDALMRAAGRY
ncbi:extracellular solute-binding protein [Amaricoccus solimangrovi]|nr:extracellular solute-binding protein [Amaricoccus solimangrovi]